MQPLFWMGNHLASQLVEISDDLNSLRKPGFWVVFGSFEGDWRLARFARVEQSNLPKSELSWNSISNEDWQSTLIKAPTAHMLKELERRLLQVRFIK